MKKIHLFSLCLLLFMQSMIAHEPKTWFKQLRIDIHDLMEGTASAEQKERLAKQAGITILSLSISLYCVTALSAMRHGHSDEIRPLTLGALPRRPLGPKGRRGPSRRARRRSDSALPRHGALDVPEDVKKVFDDASMPDPREVKRQEDSPGFKQTGHKGEPDTVLRKKKILSEEALSQERLEELTF